MWTRVPVSLLIKCRVPIPACKEIKEIAAFFSFLNSTDRTNTFCGQKRGLCSAFRFQQRNWINTKQWSSSILLFLVQLETSIQPSVFRNVMHRNLAICVLIVRRWLDLCNRTAKFRNEKSNLKAMWNLWEKVPQWTSWKSTNYINAIQISGS